MVVCSLFLQNLVLTEIVFEYLSVVVSVSVAVFLSVLLFISMIIKATELSGLASGRFHELKFDNQKSIKSYNSN